MAKEFEYLGDDIAVVSRNPLKGTLTLVAYDEDGDPCDMELALDKQSAEDLISALVQFTMRGEGDDMPMISIGKGIKP
ncbi:hypothetical protein [Mesorhizobium sp. B2-4-6]|uniref:hypothetical protein n=1 Tax=Mesorhizobium sp. B2-4-6 TaxID=2589943 RepID=UPI00112A9D57|nr:hypothetical protein [Mesorhizobium sp. B2-4-6]TPL40709.1 hypothetical protein FJ957_26115 [Mesorhizobium sp. B2-4-6]